MPVTPIKSLEEFRKIIGGDQPVVVDFWATWCGPCRVIGPVFERFSDNITSLAFYKVDVDENDDIGQEANIRVMPTFIAYQNGQKIDEFIGANPSGLEAFVKTTASISS